MSLFKLFNAQIIEYSLTIILPMLATPVIVATGRKPDLREAVTIITSLAQLYFVVNLYQGIKQGESISVFWW